MKENRTGAASSLNFGSEHALPVAPSSDVLRYGGHSRKAMTEILADEQHPMLSKRF